MSVGPPGGLEALNERSQQCCELQRREIRLTAEKGPTSFSCFQFLNVSRVNLHDGPSLTKFTVAWKRQFCEKLAPAAPGYLEIFNCTTCSYNVNKKQQDCRQIGALRDLFSSIVAWQPLLKHTTLLFLWRRGVTRRSPSH